MPRAIRSYCHTLSDMCIKMSPVNVCNFPSYLTINILLNCLELYQTGVICFGTASSIMWCVWNLNFCHTLFWNSSEFYTIPCLSSSVYISIGMPTWMLSLCSNRSCLMLCLSGAPFLRGFQTWGRRCKRWDSQWFQVCKMRYRGMQ